MIKWQPVMLVSDERIECNECGALAIFIVLERQATHEPQSETHTGVDYDHTAWCQECFRKAQESEE